MRRCVIDGCPFPGIAYFGDMEEPINEDEITTYVDTCFFCEGKGCRICDGNGKIMFFDYAGETRKTEYWECLFHYGAFCYVAYLFKSLIKKARRLIR